MKTLDELNSELAEVRKAIKASYGSKSYSITSGTTSRQLERQSIKQLTDREAQLEREITRMSGGGVRWGVPTP